MRVIRFKEHFLLTDKITVDSRFPIPAAASMKFDTVHPEFAANDAQRIDKGPSDRAVPQEDEPFSRTKKSPRSK
jgi:hypothetical protein